MHDKSNKQTCIESIKRFTIPPFQFDLTNIQEGQEQLDLIRDLIDLDQDEEIICSTYVNEKLWSILTTRRIKTLEGVRKKDHILDKLKRFDSGDFKGYSGQKFTKGFLQFEDDVIVPIFIETGRASMVMIYGIKTIFDSTRVNRQYFDQIIYSKT